MDATFTTSATLPAKEPRSQTLPSMSLAENPEYRESRAAAMTREDLAEYEARRPFDERPVFNAPLLGFAWFVLCRF